MTKQVAAALALFLFFMTAPDRGFANNGLQFSAIGAYQQGMAGAVTAAPYDSSTAVTNPAGMAMIGSRTDFSFGAHFPKRELSFDFGGGTAKGGSRFYPSPSAGWTAPANEKGNLFFGGGIFTVSSMGVDYDVVSAPLFEPPFDAGSAEAHIWSQYQFLKIAPTLAWTSGTFAAGIALNLDYQTFGFKNLFTGTAAGSPAKFGMDLSETQAAAGVGGTIGFLYQPVPAFAVGLSYASKQFFTDFKWQLAAGDVDFSAMGGPASQNGTYTMSLDFPQQAAFGIAVRPVRTVLWTADAKWINYHDTHDTVKLKGDFTGGAKELPLDPGWEDVFVYATALQIDVTPKIVLRAGFNYSSSPIKPEMVDNNTIFPMFPVFATKRASGGFTYRFGRNWEVTIAYMKTLKEEIKSDSGSGTKISFEESAGDFELSYRF